MLYTANVLLNKYMRPNLNNATIIYIEISTHYFFKHQGYRIWATKYVTTSQGNCIFSRDPKVKKPGQNQISRFIFF